MIVLHSSSSLLCATTERVDNPELPATLYSGMTICGYCDDSEDHITANRRSLAEVIDCKGENIISVRQVHGTRVVRLSDPCDLPDMTAEADAIVTDRRGIAIGVHTADCVPIIIADRESGVAAAVHAGWRGAVAGVVEESLAMMRDCGAKDFEAWIGPCIRSCCFEVGEEVAAKFPDRFVERRSGRKPYVDLAGFVKDILKSNGVANVADSGLCTRCEPLRFFSARANGIKSGRNFTFVIMR